MPEIFQGEAHDSQEGLQSVNSILKQRLALHNDDFKYAILRLKKMTKAQLRMLLLAFSVVFCVLVDSCCSRYRLNTIEIARCIQDNGKCE